MFRLAAVAAATTVSVCAGIAASTTAARAEQSLDCSLNERKQTCVVEPWKNGGLEIRFSGGAIYRFIPAGTPTTDKRRMRDEQGRIWLMSGHHSFTLSEQNGDSNLIAVSSVKSRPSQPIDHQAHGKVKLSGHGRPTVPLYAQPSYGAPLSGMGVSGETLDKLECTSNSQGTWCRVGYPGQSGRVLWVNRDALIFISDGE